MSSRLTEFKDLPGDVNQIADLAYRAFHDFSEEPDFETLDQEEQDKWMQVADQVKAQLTFDHLSFQHKKDNAVLGDQLFILSEALCSPADRSRPERSHTWWALYTLAIAIQMKSLAGKLPGLLAHVLLNPEVDDAPQS